MVTKPVTRSAQEAALCADVAVLLGMVVRDLDALERALAALKRRVGVDEKVVEAMLATVMAGRTIGPVAEAWADGADPEGARLTETVGAVLRAALASGRAHVRTQAGGHLPAVTAIPTRGAAETAATSPGDGAVMYWLETLGDQGGFAMAGTELVALLTGLRPELGTQSGNRLLTALLDTGALLAGDLKGGRWAVRVEGKSRRMVVVPAEVVFPSQPPPEGVDESAGRPVDPEVRQAPSETPTASPAASPGPEPGPPESTVTPSTSGTPEPGPGPEVDRPEVDQAMDMLTAAGLVDVGPDTPQGTVVVEGVAQAEEVGPTTGAFRSGPATIGRTQIPPGPARARRDPRQNSARPVSPGPAVLAPGKLILPGGKQITVDSPIDVGHLAELVLAGGARGVMVHPSAPDPTGLVERPEDRPMQTVRADGGRSVTVVLLAHDTERVCGPWKKASTVEDLVAGLERFRRAVGHPWRSSVGRTGEALLRWTHPVDKGGTQPGRAPEIPEPATDGSMELAFMWQRHLAEDERSRPWVHMYDKNSQYLSVWESVELGLGAPEHHGGPIDIEAWVTRRASGARLVAPPGLWRVALPEAPIDEALPNPWGNGRSCTEWVTTPTLARVFEVYDGNLPTIAEAWQWQEHSRYLRGTAERLRDARTALLDDSTPPGQLALAAVKDLYRRGTGRMAMEDRNPNSGWPRPDWRLAIIAQARVNLHRTLTKVSAAPFAVLVDGLCFAADEADPTVFAAAIGLPVGTGLGQFSYQGTAALPPLLDELDQAASAAATVKVFKGASRGSV